MSPSIEEGDVEKKRRGGVAEIEGECIGCLDDFGIISENQEQVGWGFVGSRETTGPSSVPSYKAKLVGNLLATCE